MNQAMFAFSGDPITYGHIDIIATMTRTYDRVVVGFGDSEKNCLFTLEERMDMAYRSLRRLPFVEVVAFKGLLVDYAWENGIGTIVKGVRNAADFNYESELHQVGESQNLGIITSILAARPDMAHIRSSTVKQMQRLQADIHTYVPSYVKQCLEAKISGQYIVGMTGESGVGKTYVAKRFVELGSAIGLPVHHIDLDRIGHQILGELQFQKYKEVRQQIADAFGDHVMRPDGFIDRRRLGEIVFSDAQALDRLNKIMYTPLLVRLRKEMYQKRGLLLFDAALIAESDMAYLCNNNVVLVRTDRQTQQSQLESRGMSPTQISRRLASQFNFDEKLSKLQAAIERDDNGQIWIVDNYGDHEVFDSTFREVVSGMKAK